MHSGLGRVLRRVDSAFELLGGWLQPLFLLAFRVTWGWQLAQAGLGKLQNHERTVSFFTGLGIPLPEMNAWFVGGAELIGGAFLLLGVLSRPTALMVTVNMLVAYLSVEEDRAALVGVFSNVEAFTAAAPFFFLLTALLILSFGPGKLSVDALIKALRARE